MDAVIADRGSISNEHHMFPSSCYGHIETPGVGTLSCQNPPGQEENLIRISLTEKPGDDRNCRCNGSPWILVLRFRLGFCGEFFSAFFPGKTLQETSKKKPRFSRELLDPHPLKE